MKRLTVVLSVLILAGCATGQTPEYKAYLEHVNTQKPRAQSGEIKWSEYLLGLYGKALTANAPGQTLSEMNRLIGHAKRFEAGEITRDEFDHIRRQSSADSQSRYQAAVAQANAEQQQSNAALMAVGAQLLSASGPYTMPQPANHSPSPIPGYLQGQSVNGSLRHCRYSNGVVTTVTTVTLCPINDR